MNLAAWGPGQAPLRRLAYNRLAATIRKQPILRIEPLHPIFAGRVIGAGSGAPAGVRQTPPQ